MSTTNLPRLRYMRGETKLLLLHLLARTSVRYLNASGWKAGAKVLPRITTYRNGKSTPTGTIIPPLWSGRANSWHVCPFVSGRVNLKRLRKQAARMRRELIVDEATYLHNVQEAKILKQLLGSRRKRARQ